MEDVEEEEGANIGYNWQGKFDVSILIDCVDSLIVQRFNGKAIRHKVSVFDVKFKLYPYGYAHTFKSHIQNMIENLLFNYPNHNKFSILNPPKKCYTTAIQTRGIAAHIFNKSTNPRPLYEYSLTF